MNEKKSADMTGDSKNNYNNVNEVLKMRLGVGVTILFFLPFHVTLSEVCQIRH